MIPNVIRAAVLGLFLSAAAHAQSLTFGQIEGVVRDGSQRPVPSAEVRIEDRASGAVRFTATARNGTFRIVSIPAGRYDVRVEALGYRPVVLLDIDVGPDRSARLAPVIRLAPPPVTTVDTVARRGDLATASDWLFERGYAELVGARRLASDVAGLSTTADESGVEGLPWRFTEAMVEGSRVSSVGSPAGSGLDGATLALPTRALSSARVGGLGFDVEVGGSGLGVLATSQRGGRVPVTRATTEGGTANIGVGLSGGGALQGDTANANVGVDYQRSNIGPLEGAAAERTDERFSAFGRMDWQPGDRIAITARASGSRYTSTGPAERVGLASAFGNEFEAYGLQAAVNVHAQLTTRYVTEWRFSGDVGSATGRSTGAPRTAFAETGLDVGSVVGGPFEDAAASSRATGLLHGDFGAHRLKLGFTAALHQHDASFVRDGDGLFAFGIYDAGNVLQQQGAWRRVESTAFAREFRTGEFAFLLQDAWRLADGFTITAGARIDRVQLPFHRIESNAAWGAATGLDNTDVTPPNSRVSPRLSLRWELGRAGEWVIEGGGGIFHDLPDRRDLSEALTLDRGADVRLGVGDISSWPSAPSNAVAPVVGRTLTMLGPGFEGPRTTRSALGLSRRTGQWTTSLSGVYRHTDFLSRRRDLNLSAAPIGADQHGRPLYGTLQKVGEIVTAVPGSNRRFSGFDAAHVLEASGFSSFWGATLSAQRVVPGRGLSLGLSYTYGSTLDNVAGLTAPRISPFPDGLAGDDWVEGTSDLDIPHRVVVAADWAASPAVRFGIVYRLRSGAPFTPGVRNGVDANADGDWTNDPAFVDSTLVGMSALMGDWSCLADAADKFAGRNSCRSGLVHQLDVRTSFQLGSLRVGRVELLVEGLNVLAPITGVVDRALLVVDPITPLATNPGTGVTTVPYVVNPDFGKVLANRSTGMLWRVGVRIRP